MNERTCEVPDCGRPHAAKGFCSKHYYRLRTTRSCEVDGCTEPFLAKNRCRRHYGLLERDAVCAQCGAAFRASSRTRFCSPDCRGRSKRGPMRRAVEGGDPAAVIAAALASSTVTSTGCWEWKYATSSAGYGTIGQGGRSGMVHRHVMAAALGRPLGDEPVHHKCANGLCCNPDHLQVVSQRENMAEMLLRTFYVRRIAELEAALRETSPHHPALQGVAT